MQGNEELSELASSSLGYYSSLLDVGKIAFHLHQLYSLAIQELACKTRRLHAC